MGVLKDTRLGAIPGHPVNLQIAGCPDTPLQHSGSWRTSIASPLISLRKPRIESPQLTSVPVGS